MAKFSLSIDAAHGIASPFWPAAGIALSALLVYGYTLSPAVLLAALLVHISAGVPVLPSLGIALANTLEALAATYLIHRFVGPSYTFKKIRDSFGFIGIATVFAVTIGATIGVASLWAYGMISSAQIPHSWILWWAGDVLGALIVAPFLSIWLSSTAPSPLRGLRDMSPIKIVETSALAFSILIINWAVFWQQRTSLEHFLLYPIFFPLIWSALRFNTRITSLAVIASLGSATASTLFGHGPFATASLSTSLLLMQIFIAVTTITFLIFATTVEERQRTTRALEEHVRKLKRAAEEINAVNEASQAKSDFLAVLAHELRNPLAPIFSSLELIRLTPIPDPILRAPIDTIDNQVSKMARLLDDLLEIARISKKKYI